MSPSAGPNLHRSYHRSAGHRGVERVDGHALSAVPDLEAELDVDQEPGALELTARDRVGDERLEVEAGTAGRRVPHVADHVPDRHPADPDIPARAVEIDPLCDPRAEWLRKPAMAHPDHDLGPVGLTRGRRGHVEPDVVGSVERSGAARVEVDARVRRADGADRWRRAAGGGGGPPAPVTPFVDRWIGGRRAGRQVEARGGAPEVQAGRADALLLRRVPLVRLDDVVALIDRPELGAGRTRD